VTELSAFWTALMIASRNGMRMASTSRRHHGDHHPAGDVAPLGLVELLDDDGEVDPHRVAEAIAALADSRPYLLKPSRPTPGFGQGQRSSVDTGATSGSALRGR
jgi:hypothetical protein